MPIRVPIRTMAASSLVSRMFVAFVLLFAPAVDAGLRGAHMRAEMRMQATSVVGNEGAAAEVEMTAEEEEHKDEQDNDDDEEDEDHREEDHEDDEGEDQGEHHEELGQIKKAGSMADANGDARLSIDEMMRFAEAIRHRQRKGQTAESFDLKDTDKNGFLSVEELGVNQGIKGAPGHRDSGSPNALLADYVEKKFAAADLDGDQKLNREEYHAYLHPETHDRVLQVEATFQFKVMDKNVDGFVTLEEYVDESRLGDDADFSYEDTRLDFETHDHDSDSRLDTTEFTDLVKGHVLIRSHVEKAIKAMDDDGDGHIHMHDELPNHMKEVLDNEFVEDYLLEDHGHVHMEL